MRKRRVRVGSEPPVEEPEVGEESLSALTNEEPAVDFESLADESIPVSLGEDDAEWNNEETEAGEEYVEIPDALIQGMAEKLGISADRVVAAMRDAATPQEATVPLILDPVLNDYREATPEEQERIAAGELNLLEPEDKGDPDLLTLGSAYTTGRNARFHYRWAHIKAEYRTSELAMGYVPLRESADGRHPVRMVPGVGQAVSVGDLILMRVPKEIAERRTKVQDAQRRREQEERMRGVQDDFRAKAGQFGRDVELFDEEFETNVGADYDLDRRGTEAQEDFAQLAGDAYIAASMGLPVNDVRESRMRERGELPKSRIEGFKFRKANFETSKDRQNRQRGLTQ